MTSDAVRALAAGPVKRYRTICADPPWRYYLRRHDTTHRGRCQYADMSVEEIAMLPVGDWAEDDAHLYLWTTNNHMDESAAIMRAWASSLRQF